VLGGDPGRDNLVIILSLELSFKGGAEAQGGKLVHVALSAYGALESWGKISCVYSSARNG
jgi:hypothetical protein